MDVRNNDKEYERAKRIEREIEEFYSIFIDTVRTLPHWLQELIMARKILIFKLIYNFLWKVERAIQDKKTFLASCVYISLRLIEASPCFNDEQITKPFIAKHLKVHVNTLKWYVNRVEKELGLKKILVKTKPFYMYPNSSLFRLMEVIVESCVEKHLLIAYMDGISNLEGFVVNNSFLDASYKVKRLVPDEISGVAEEIILDLVKEKAAKLLALHAV